jgi:tight adherence protein B
VSAALRADRATLQVVEGELASARATARLVAALPVFALLLSAGAGGGAWSFLTGTPPGWACLLGGLALGLAGLAWIERIAQGVLR